MSSRAGGSRTVGANAEGVEAAGHRASIGGGQIQHPVAAGQPLESYEDAMKRIRLRREAHTRQRTADNDQFRSRLFLSVLGPG